MANLKRLRGLALDAARGVWHSPTLALMLLTGLLLARFEPAYNHMVGAYALVGLLALNLKLWQGRAGAPDLALPLSFLAGAAWIFWHRNADVVPYLGILFFGVAAAACALQLALRRPLPFRDESRVAENYLDTGVRGLLALSGALMGLAWIPEPRYLAVPFTLLLAFRLAAPLRRVLYPLALRAVRLEPTSGRLAPPLAPVSGYTRPRAAALAVSLLLAALIGPRLVFTQARYDLTIPKPYALPRELLLERRAELDAYVAQPPGSVDAAALTELGLVLHELGLSDRAELRRAEQVLLRAQSLDPRNAQALAWYGSTRAAGALYEERPLPRTRLVAEGLAQLDRAVQLAPDDPIVRLARASVCLGMPGFIGRLPTARQDVDHLIGLARTHPRETDPILPFVYQRAGDTYARLGQHEQARRYWQAALLELPEPSPDYRAIAARLLALRPPRAESRLAEGARGHEARP